MSAKDATALDTRARAVYDTAAGRVLASVEVPTSAERAFQSLAGPDVIRWWVNPGVFDTREWEADLRVGGGWRAAGIGRGRAYTLEGEFLEIVPPRKLVQSWHAGERPAQSSTVTHLLDPVSRGTHLTIRHEGFREPEPCVRSAAGWETSLEALVRLLSAPE